MGRMQIHLTIYARRRLQPTTGTFVAGPSRRGNFMPDDVAEGRSSCLGVMIRHCLCNQVSSQQNWKHSCDAQIGALPVLFCDQSSTGPSCPHPRRSVHSAVARCPHRLTWQHPGRYSNQKLGSSRYYAICGANGTATRSLPNFPTQIQSQHSIGIYGELSGMTYYCITCLAARNRGLQRRVIPKLPVVILFSLFSSS